MATCWICLDNEGPDGASGPLCRSCSCRGNAGMVHLACIAAFAASRTEQTMQDAANGRIPHPVDLLDRLRNLWSHCPNCKQQYHGAFGVDLARSFVDHASSHPDDDIRSLLAQLTLGLALISRGLSEESVPAYSKVWRVLDDTPRSVPQPFRFLIAFEALNQFIEVEEKRRNYAECLALAEALHEEVMESEGRGIGLAPMVAAKINHFANLAGRGRRRGITKAESKIELLRTELQTSLVRGPDCSLAFQCQRELITALHDDGQWVEALCRAEDCRERSGRTLGADHPLHLDFEAFLARESVRHYLRFRDALAAEGKELSPQMRVATAAIRGYPGSSGLNDRSCFLTKLGRDDKYVAYVETTKDDAPLKKCKVAVANVRLDDKTSIVCRGLNALPDGTMGKIAGYREETDRYETKMHDDGSMKLIPSDKVRVMFK